MTPAVPLAAGPFPTLTSRSLLGHLNWGSLFAYMKLIYALVTRASASLEDVLLSRFLAKLCARLSPAPLHYSFRSEGI